MFPKHGRNTALEANSSPFRIFVEGPIVRSARSTNERFAGRGPPLSAIQRKREIIKIRIKRIL